jgi:hypothetical protein
MGYRAPMPERVMKRPGAAVRGHDIAAVNVNAGIAAALAPEAVAMPRFP